MLEVVVIPWDIDEPIEVRNIKGELHEYQEIVGGYITATDIPKLNASIYSNDEGLLIGLDVNMRANALLWANAPEHVDWTLLVGNVVVVGMPDKNGNTTQVPKPVINVLDRVEGVKHV